MMTGFGRKVDENCSLLDMGPIGSPETSVRNYHYSPCNNPEERSSRGPTLFESGVVRGDIWA